MNLIRKTITLLALACLAILAAGPFYAQASVPAPRKVTPKLAYHGPCGTPSKAARIVCRAHRAHVVRDGAPFRTR